MDRYYNCDNQSYNFVGRKVNVEKYFGEFSLELKTKEDESLQDLLQKIWRDDDLTHEKMMNLEDYCDVSKLDVKGEPIQVKEDVKSITSTPDFYPKAQAPIDLELETFKQEIKCNRKRRVPLKLDYIETRVKQSKNSDLVPGQDFIVIVRIFPPYKQETGGKTDFSKTYTQEIILSGNNTLSDLRDSIQCLEDYQENTGDLSEIYTSKDDHVPVQLRNNAVYPNGLFYIDNTFFIDTRHANHKDYSKLIRDWSNKCNIGLSNDPPTPMHNFKICDLSVRFGFPYLYQHQGNCEHLIIFSDARLMHPTKDNLRSENYPLITNRREQSHSCMACGLRISEWVVKECKRFPHDIAFLCNECHFLYNYVNRKKVDNFKAYRFWDRTEFLSRKS